MKPKTEQRIAGQIAKTLTMLCVRNTCMEDFHSGTVPVTHTGDYSDVRVIDADGREIAWNDAAHLDQDQMRALIKQIVNRIYTFHMLRDDFEFRASLDQWVAIAEKWDEPEMDQDFIGTLAK